MLMLLPLLAVLLPMMLLAASSRTHVLHSGSYLFACSNRSHFQRLQPGPQPGCLLCTRILCLRLSSSSSCQATVTARACRWCRWVQSVGPGLEKEGLPLPQFQELLLLEGLPLSPRLQCHLLRLLRLPQRQVQGIKSMDHHGHSAWVTPELLLQGLPLRVPLFLRFRSV